MTSEEFHNVRAIVRAKNAGAIRWSEQPWRSVWPILKWFGFSPPEDSAGNVADLKTLTDWSTLILENMVASTGELVWSSYRLSSALRVVADVGLGVPEPLLNAEWKFFENKPLDKNVYEFCRDQGRFLLSDYRSRTEWDLMWMLDVGTPSQLCLRYWSLGVKPSLCVTSVEDATLEVLSRFPFQF